MEEYIKEIREKLEEAKDNLSEREYFLLLSTIISIAEREIEY